MPTNNLTAEQILKISQPEQLFSNDFGSAKVEYHALSGEWHPDANLGRDTSDVFVHIKQLYDIALTKIGTIHWNAYHKFTLTKKNGSILTRNFHSKHQFELGDCYIGDVAVTYVVKHDFEQAYQNAISMINALPYRDAKVRAMISPLMPNIETTFEAEEGLVLVIKKSKNVLVLSDILRYLSKIDEKHTAWIFGRLMNICCYLQFVAKITHNSINPETIFIEPTMHSVHLFGGWWYASPISAPQLLGVPKYTIDHGYPSIMRTQKPDFKNDLTLAKAVARQLLGDVNGLSYLTKDSTLPKPLVEWFAQPTSGNALTDYKDWETVRDKSFGLKRFIKLCVSAKDLYPTTH